MKKSIIVIDLTLSVALIVLAIINFVVGNIIIGIVDLISFALIIFAVLDHMAFNWKYDIELRKKFTFTCKNCQYQFIPTFWRWFLVPHLGSKRYFRCDECKKLSWMRRK